MSKFLEAVTMVLRHEGGLERNEDGSDAGGISNHGISLRFYKTIKPDATAWDIESLSITEAEDIYQRKFWIPMRLDEIENQKLTNRVLDLAVNTGMREAALMLQRALNSIHPKICVIDGVIGIRTIAAANGQNPDALYNRLILEATKYYNEISRLGKNHVFLDPWLIRLNDTP